MSGHDTKTLFYLGVLEKSMLFIFFGDEVKT